MITDALTQALMTAIADNFKRFEQEVLNKERHRLNTDSPRFHVGASQVTTCPRRMFFTVRKFSPAPLSPTEKAEQQLIFHTGHWVEHKVLTMLEMAGFQYERPHITTDYPLFKGTVDGVITNTPLEFAIFKGYLIEIKSANESRFNQLKDKPLLQWSQEYYLQVQLYMHFLKLQNCLFIVLNKSNNKLLIQEIPLNQSWVNIGLNIYQTAFEQTIEHTKPVCNSLADAYKNHLFCPFKQACFNSKTPITLEKSCRNCTNLDITTMICCYYFEQITTERARNCEHYKPFLPYGVI